MNDYLMETNHRTGSGLTDQLHMPGKTKRDSILVDQQNPTVT